MERRVAQICSVLCQSLTSRPYQYTPHNAIRHLINPDTTPKLSFIASFYFLIHVDPIIPSSLNLPIMITTQIEIARSPEEVKKIVCTISQPPPKSPLTTLEFLDFPSYNLWHQGLYKSITPLSPTSPLSKNSKLHCVLHDDFTFDGVITVRPPLFARAPTYQTAGELTHALPVAGPPSEGSHRAALIRVRGEQDYPWWHDVQTVRGVLRRASFPLAPMAARPVAEGAV